MIATDRAVVLSAATWDPSILLYGAYLAGALLVAAVAVEIFRRYLRAERKDRLTASDQLAHFRSLYEEGIISEEEFNSLRSLLGAELRQASRKPAPATDVPPIAPRTTNIAPTNREDTPNSNRPTPPPETGIKPA
jgi:hypothetical protein